MHQPSDRHVSILSTGAYLPGDPIDNAALERLAGPLPDDILQGMEVQRRHWMIDPLTGEHRTSTSKMGTAAARQALDRAGLEPGDIDLLVMSTASPDYVLPAAATYVQEQLGLERCAVIEVRAGCVGAVQAVDIARRNLADGTYRNALVVASESISPFLAPFYLGMDPHRVRMRDRLTLYTFGDGAGAIVMRAGEPGSVHRSTVPEVFATQCIGGLRKPGMVVLGGGTDAPMAEQQRRKRLMDIRLDIPGTAEVGPRVFVEALKDMLGRSGLAMSDIDACVLPEGNAEYFSSEFEAVGLNTEDHAALQKNIVENLTDVGATGSAAVPLALDAGWVEGRIRPGDTVMLLAIEASRYLYAGLTLGWEAPTPAA